MVVIILNNYYISKDKTKKETMYLEYDKIDGYQIKPKTKKEDQIKVSKIVFANKELSEKLIRRKIDSKLLYLLKQIKFIEENPDDDSSDGVASKTLMEAEKLRMQIINNYVKYLGHTYESLTLKKIEIIIEQLKYKIYLQQEQELYQQEQKSKRSR